MNGSMVPRNIAPNMFIEYARTISVNFPDTNVERYDKERPENVAPPSNQQSRPTQNVHVLLMYWEEDDMQVWREINGLRHVLEVNYNFDIKIFEIPSQNPDDRVEAALLEMKGKLAPGDLAIVYYGGHGAVNPMLRLCISANQERNTPRLDWSVHQARLQRWSNDVVIILDCCDAAGSVTTVPKDNSSGRTEIIAAAGSPGSANRPSGPLRRERFSFTDHLTSQLRERLQTAQQGGFTVASLYKGLLQDFVRDNFLPRNDPLERVNPALPTPVHIMLKDTPEPSIIIRTMTRSSERSEAPGTERERLEDEGLSTGNEEETHESNPPDAGCVQEELQEFSTDEEYRNTATQFRLEQTRSLQEAVREFSTDERRAAARRVLLEQISSLLAELRELLTEEDQDLNRELTESDEVLESVEVENDFHNTDLEDSVKDVGTLREIFEGQYHFTVSVCRIPSKDPFKTADSMLSQYKSQFSDPDSLLIVYYSRHSSVGPGMRLHLSATNNPETEAETRLICPSGRAYLDWMPFQAQLECMDSDFLIILDSCESAGAVFAKQYRNSRARTELIAGCGYPGLSYGFTEPLRAVLHHGRELTVLSLYTNLLRLVLYDNHFKHLQNPEMMPATPVYINLTSGAEKPSIPKLMCLKKRCFSPGT
ncbi:hypothetical protein G7Y89_g1434 [Cudoniella acicularis]|uniref:Peptidase C14 caspase domain-containing protein n=1 Tax=Cudoniella acicularis TaxID=354080 RepID=A0A8H4RVA4_9HELO|nr:hypothetical protein G7Y89_g1434 [Cudoniella acicularis]